MPPYLEQSPSTSHLPEMLQLVICSTELEVIYLLFTQPNCRHVHVHTREFQNWAKELWPVPREMQEKITDFQNGSHSVHCVNTDNRPGTCHG